MILCVKCGHRNRQGNRFCTACGNRFLEDEAPPIARLALLYGDKSQSSLLSEVTCLVGRDRTNDFVVKDDLVSGRHMKLCFVDGAFWVDDVGSRNGTFVNGVRVTASKRLVNGDLIRIGQTIFRFEF